MKSRISFIFIIILAVLTVGNNDGFAQRIKWQQTSGPGGGLISSMSILNDGLIFVIQSELSIDGGQRVYRSPDSGKTWSQVTGLSKASVTHAFTEIDGLVFASDLTGYIYISSDRGASWSRTKSGFMPCEFPKLNFVSKDGVLFWSGKKHGVFRSNDSGNSWKNIFNGLPYYMKYDTLFGYPTVDTILYSIDDFARCRSGVLAATPKGVYKYINAVDKWESRNNGLMGLGVTAMTSIGDTVFAVTKSGVFSSINGGDDWLLSLNITPLYVKSSNEMISVYAKDSSYWISTDVGKTWVNRSEQISSRNVTAIGLIGKTNFISTFGQGVLRSDDSGKTWLQSNAFLNCIRSWDMVLHKGSIYASGMQCGIFKTDDGGENWSQVWVTPETYSVNTFFDGLGFIFAAIDPELYRSSDNGQTWSNNAIWNGPTHQRIEAIGIARDELIAGAEMGWFVSSDSGDSWALRSTNCGPGGDVQAAVFVQDTIWDLTGCGLKWSINRANSWGNAINVGHSAIVSNDSKKRFHMHGAIAKYIQSPSGNYPLTEHLPNHGAFNILCTQSRIFACTPTGVYETTNFGETWFPDTNGMGAMRVNDIVADGDTLYASTENGVYRGVYVNLTGVNTNTIDNSSTILELYPNPSHGHLNITYSIGDGSDVKFEIINVLGQVIKTFQIEQQVSGTYTHKYDISSLPTSSYFVRMTTENGLKMKSLKIFK